MDGRISNPSPWSNKGLPFVLNENHKANKCHKKSAKYLEMLKNDKIFLKNTRKWQHI